VPPSNAAFTIYERGRLYRVQLILILMSLVTRYASFIASWETIAPLLARKWKRAKVFKNDSI